MSFNSVSVLAYGIALHDKVPAFLNGFSGFVDYARVQAGLPAFDSPEFDEEAFYEFMAKFPAQLVTEMSSPEGEYLTVLAARGQINEAFDGEAVGIFDLSVDKNAGDAFAAWAASVGLGDMTPQWYLLNVPVELTDMDFSDEDAALAD